MAPGGRAPVEPARPPRDPPAAPPPQRLRLPQSPAPPPAPPPTPPRRSLRASPRPSPLPPAWLGARARPAASPQSGRGGDGADGASEPVAAACAAERAAPLSIPPASFSSSPSFLLPPPPPPPTQSPRFPARTTWRRCRGPGLRAALPTPGARRWCGAKCSTWDRATPTSPTSARGPTAWCGECRQPARLGQRPCPQQLPPSLPPSLPAALPGRSLRGARPRAPARPCVGGGEAGAPASLPRSPQLCFSLRAPEACPSGIPFPLPRCRLPPLPKFLHPWVQLNVSFPFSRAFISLDIFRPRL